MNLFVYEFVTGGGFGNVSGNCVPSPTLRREGLAMAAALTADFAKIDDVHVVTTWDARAQRRSDDFAPGVSVEPVGSPTEESTVFGRLLAECDRAVIIAPETDGILHERSRAAGDKLLGSSLDVIALATNKWRMHEHLRSHGVPTPRSIALSDPPRRDELLLVGAGLQLHVA